MSDFSGRHCARANEWFSRHAVQSRYFPIIFTSDCHQEITASNSNPDFSHQNPPYSLGLELHIFVPLHRVLTHLSEFCPCIHNYSNSSQFLLIIPKKQWFLPKPSQSWVTFLSPIHPIFSPAVHVYHVCHIFIKPQQELPADPKYVH